MLVTAPGVGRGSTRAGATASPTSRWWPPTCRTDSMSRQHRTMPTPRRPRRGRCTPDAGRALWVEHSRIGRSPSRRTRAAAQCRVTRAEPVRRDPGLRPRYGRRRWRLRPRGGLRSVPARDASTTPSPRELVQSASVASRSRRCRAPRSSSTATPFARSAASPPDGSTAQTSPISPASTTGRSCASLGFGRASATGSACRSQLDEVQIVLTKTVRSRGPSNSHKNTACRSPSASLPSRSGIVSEEDISAARTCAHGFWSASCTCS